MGCEHEHLRTVGDRLFCKDCGDELPIEFLTKKTPVVAAETAEIPAEEKKTGKSPAKKRTPKKAE